MRTGAGEAARTADDPSAATTIPDGSPPEPPVTTRLPDAPTSGAPFVAKLLLFGALVGIGPLTMDMYLAAFPAVVSDLSTTASAVQLTLTATLVGLASGQLIIGAVSDTLGRRRPLITALVGYVAASVLIALSDSIAALLVLRFFQGLTAAAGMVLSQAMVRDLYSGSVMARFISRLFLIVGVAPIIAPTLGAQFLYLGTWRTIFWALAGIGLLLTALAIWRVQETLPEERRGSRGLRPVARSYRVLLTDRRYVGLVLTAATAMGALFAYISSATFIFQDLYGFSTQEYALVFAAGAGSLTIASQVNGSLVRRHHPVRILQVALPAGLLAGLGLLVVALLDLGPWPLVVGIVLLLGTVGFVMPNNPVIALHHHARRAGSAAALLGATNFVLGALISPLSGLFNAASAVPMAAIMVGCSVLSLTAFHLLAKPRDILRDMAWE
ncbi:multidrug effflux MFS transporter [Ornithinicoccus halotolerans]|uniref:multidrug effflux MFS transporter n=1 Tax=Ornithinicoccus halotolerans TaxID=1748220 RepID=UPI00129538EE|nr:multidrug effflux MFS transporter [Ornithinicoccus halotolerans]